MHEIPLDTQLLESLSLPAPAGPTLPTPLSFDDRVLPRCADLYVDLVPATRHSTAWPHHLLF